MSQRAHFLIFLLYVLAAVGLAIWLPAFMPRVSPVLGAIAGGFLFLAGGLLHQSALAERRSRDQALDLAVIGRQLAAVLRDQRRLEDDLLQLRATLANLASTPQQDVGGVVAEVKVLQKLIEQLYSSRTAGKAPPPAPASAPKETSAPKPGPKLVVSKPEPGSGAAAMDIPLDQPLRAPPAAQAAAPATPATAGSNASIPMPPVAYDLGEDEILDALRDGLRENGVELALQPIVSLPQRKRRYFECFSRVRVADGRVLIPEQYIELAERHGLVTAIDNMQLFRCIQTLRRIRKSNASVGFFLNISHHTLA
ncbi:MAG: EAL domain-containing protein, partial [Rhodospirillaceae bacterium]|nr:EAL domain-containing protein [Rhodospirillaceae bacterium]